MGRTEEKVAMHVLHVVGARPNFMKAAPVIKAIEGRGGFEQTLVHTGQHYDINMSEIFFRQLGMPEPDIDLEVGSGSHAQQTALIMTRFEPVAMEKRPDLVLVYGDVNSTIAAALVCAKLEIPVGHVEAGLRSFDRMMPEEINRLLTDQIADLLFTPSVDGNENLAREGIKSEKIFFVGNVMIDTLVRLLPKAEDVDLKGLANKGKDLSDIFANMDSPRQCPYILVTLHRPSNVDNPDMIADIMEALAQLSAKAPVIFPIHPRTRKRLEGSGLSIKAPRLFLIDPVGYVQFLALQKRASVVVTDSGGIQEETTFLKVPCLTVRLNTERPVTVTMGTNTLIGQDMAKLMREVDIILSGNRQKGEVPPLWDGKASERIAGIIEEWCRARR